MLLLKDEHRSKAHSPLATGTNVQALGLGLLQHLVAAGAVPSDKGAAVLAAEVEHLTGVLGGKLVKLLVQVVSDLGGPLDQVQSRHLVKDAAEEQGADGVAHPGVELAVGLVGSQGVVTVVEAGGLSLLGKGHHVGRSLETPVLMGPELASGADAGLHLVDNHQDVLLLGNLAQAAEEFGRGMVVTTLRLDGLNNNGSDGVVPGGNQALRFLEAALLLGGILSCVLLEGVLELGERGSRPVKRGDVHLVDSLAAGGGQTAKGAAVEAMVEGKDGVVGRAGFLVEHDGRQLLGGELGTAALLGAAPQEGRLVGRLVGIGAGHGGKDLAEALGGGLEQTGLEDVGPVVGGEGTEGGAVDDGAHHLGGLGDFEEAGIVVAQGNGGDLGESSCQVSSGQRIEADGVNVRIEHGVAVMIDDAAVVG